VIGRFLCWLANSHVPRTRFELVRPNQEAGIYDGGFFTYEECERCGRAL